MTRGDTEDDVTGAGEATNTTVGTRQTGDSVVVSDAVPVSPPAVLRDESTSGSPTTRGTYYSG